MYSGYTESEICMLYREAKNKKLQIEILTQLTGLRSFEVERILEKGGYIVMADIEKIKELHAQGMSMNGIAKEMGLGVSTINYHLERLGLKTNGKGKLKKEDKKLEEVKIFQPELKQDEPGSLEELKKETSKNYEELKNILPKSVPAPEDIPINYDVIETLTPQQYYELANKTLDLLKTIWG